MSADSKIQLRPGANILLDMIIYYLQICFASKNQKIGAANIFPFSGTMSKYNILLLEVEFFTIFYLFKRI